MANIRIRELPADPAPQPTDIVPVDSNTTRGSTLAQLVDAARPKASQSEAEAGTDPNKAMTPLTTKQAITYQTTTAISDAISNLNLGDAAFASVADFSPADQAVPVGGTTSQVLAKQSDANNDLVWTNAGSGDMARSVYDETGKIADAFAYPNFHSELEFFGVAGLNGAKGIGTNEARSAIGLAPVRRSMTVKDAVYILDSEDIMPAVHYGGLAEAGNCYLDVAGMRFFDFYVLMNNSVAGGIVTIDCGAEFFFRGTGIGPAVSTTRQIDILPGELAFLCKAGGNVINIFRNGQSGWNVSGDVRWRRAFDGTLDVEYWQEAAITATTEVTISVPTNINLSTARVVSVTTNQRPDGTIVANDLPLRVTKKASIGSLANYQFGLYNPNSVSVRWVLVTFSGATYAS